MAIHVVPNKVRTIWNEEEIRIVVMASLLLQILLILVGPLRKRMRTKLLAYALWSFYLAADYMAIFAVGNIFSGQISFEDNTQLVSLDAELLAFWAPFLLLHLGGPDTITSYSLEDNELWSRHFLGLVVQASMVLLVLLYSSFSSCLILAGTLLVFLAGFIKFAERIYALLLASNNSRNQTFLSILLLTSPDDGASEIRETNAHSTFFNSLPRTESMMISTAYYFFVSCFASVFDNNEKIRSFHFIRECDSEEKFHMAEIEASFLHDLLHTKASCLRALHGVAWRCGTLVMVLTSLLLFHLSEKQGYKKINVVITYILVCMGVLLEVISVLTMIVSDWTIAFLERKGRKKIAKAICNVVHCAFGKSKPRWSNQMEQYNLIRIFLKSIHRPSIVRRLLCFFNLEDKWNNFWYVDHVELGAKMKDLIIQSIRLPYVTYYGDEYIQPKLDTIYKPEPSISESQWLVINDMFSFSLNSLEELIKWHIVTELHYNMTNASEREDEKIVMFKLIGYQLSNYIMNCFGMESRPIIQSVFGELKESLMGQSITEVEACHQLFIIPLGNGILSEATSLARKLNEMDVGLRWRVICMIWVNMLIYRVSDINFETMVSKPNLTMLVWFLNNHMNMFYLPMDRPALSLFQYWMRPSQTKQK